MRINTNISSLVAQENSTLTNNKLKSSLEKLSTGYKINKASDDASGLAIADKLRTQATSISQGIDNGNSAVSLLQIADKSMAEQSNILDIVKSKLIQANTDTTSDDGREAIRKDIKKLLEQLDNIAEQTNYNGLALLEPTSSTTGSSSSSSSSSSTTTNINETLTPSASLTINDSNSVLDLNILKTGSTATGVTISGTGGTLESNFGQIIVNSNGDTNFESYLASQVGSQGGSNFASFGGPGSGQYMLDPGFILSLDGQNYTDIILDFIQDIDLNGANLTKLDNTTSNSANIVGTETTTTTTSSTSSSETTTMSAGLSFQIGESGDDLINSVNIQSNTLGLGGGSEKIDQTSGSATRNNQIASNESMIFFIDGDGNSATIDADSGATNVTISGEVQTLNFNETSGTLTNLDINTYNLLSNLANNIDGTSGSETIGGTTVTLSDGATITKSGGTFTISNGASLTFSDGYEVSSMDIKESSSDGTISVSNANNLLVTNLSSSNTVEITSTASGSLTGGQTLASLKNLDAGELTRDIADRYQSVVDAAISGLNDYRADIGSTQNQVESAVRNLMTQHTNVKAAESIIRDVDYAKESANFNKQNIISQAGSYAITQANNAQQNVLRLLA